MTSKDQRPDESTARGGVDMMTVAAAIVEHSNGQPGLGQILCPVCKTGTIAYSIATPTSIAALCSTPGCVSFTSESESTP